MGEVMKNFPSCEVCEVGIYDPEAQQRLCDSCDGINNFRELGLDAIDLFAQALAINDNYCQSCWDREHNQLPDYYMNLQKCPLCEAKWNEEFESASA
jgi:hypothetical protein